jgi:hypothetical protein
MHCRENVTVNGETGDNGGKLAVPVVKRLTFVSLSFGS